MKNFTATAKEIIKYLARKSGKPMNEIAKAYANADDLLSFMKATLSIPSPPSQHTSTTPTTPISYKTQAVIDGRLELLGKRDYPVYLDHGCGSGVITSEIRDVIGATTVYGVDVYTHPNIPGGVRVIHPADDGSIDLPDGSVDMVTCLLSLHHVPKELQVKTLSELVRILSDTGIILIYEHNMIRPADGKTQLRRDHRDVFNLREYLDAVHMTFMFYGTENENSVGNDPSNLTREDVQWIFDSTYHSAEWYRLRLADLGMKKYGRSSTKNRQEMYFESFVKASSEH
jgi:hypothetical protein